jgi:hypothetical protein
LNSVTALAGSAVAEAVRSSPCTPVTVAVIRAQREQPLATFPAANAHR